MPLYQQSVCVVQCGVVCGGHAALALQAARCCTHCTALHSLQLHSVQCLQSAASHHLTAPHSPGRTAILHSYLCSEYWNIPFQSHGQLVLFPMSLHFICLASKLSNENVSRCECGQAGSEQKMLCGESVVATGQWCSVWSPVVPAQRTRWPADQPGRSVRLVLTNHSPVSSGSIPGLTSPGRCHTLTFCPDTDVETGDPSAAPASSHFSYACTKLQVTICSAHYEV